MLLLSSFVLEVGCKVKVSCATVYSARSFSCRYALGFFNSIVRPMDTSFSDYHACELGFSQSSAQFPCFYVEPGTFRFHGMSLLAPAKSQSRFIKFAFHFSIVYYEKFTDNSFILCTCNGVYFDTVFTTHFLSSSTWLNYILDFMLFFECALVIY